MGSSLSLQGSLTEPGLATGLWELMPKPGLLREDLLGHKEIKFTMRISEQWNRGQRKLWDPPPWRFKTKA